MLNSVLKSRFNQAADLFSQNKFAEAFEAYQSIFTPNTEHDHPIDFENVAESFCLEVRLRVAFCLIELGDVTEARFELENSSTRQLVGFAGPVQKEAYLFAYANVLAKTGSYEAADELLKQAQKIAQNDLKDANTLDRICRFRLHWAKHFAQWATLLKLSQEFRVIAQENGLAALMHWSTEAICFALKGLHQYAEAKQGAITVCERLEKSGARPEHIAVWTKFISDLAA